MDEFIKWYLEQEKTHKDTSHSLDQVLASLPECEVRCLQYSHDQTKPETSPIQLPLEEELDLDQHIQYLGESQADETTNTDFELDQIFQPPISYQVPECNELYQILFSSSASVHPDKNVDDLLVQEREENLPSKKRFQCTTCDKSFDRSYNLKRHGKSHTGERNFECFYCQKKFQHQFNKNRHEREVHQKELKCSKCGRAFDDKVTYTSHVRGAHKKWKIIAEDRMKSTTKPRTTSTL